MFFRVFLLGLLIGFGTCPIGSALGAGVGNIVTCKVSDIGGIFQTKNMITKGLAIGDTTTFNYADPRLSSWVFHRFNGTSNSISIASQNFILQERSESQQTYTISEGDPHWRLTTSVHIRPPGVVVELDYLPSDQPASILRLDCF